MIALAIVLQRCAIHAGASPNEFCRVVQELCKCLGPVVEEGDLFNMETELLEGARNGPMAPTSSERALSPMPRVEEPTTFLYLTLHMHPNQKGLHPLRSRSWW